MTGSRLWILGLIVLAVAAFASSRIQSESIDQQVVALPSVSASSTTAGVTASLTLPSSPTLAPGEVLWTGDAETGDVSQWRVAISGNADVAIVASPVHSGTLALQLINRDVDGTHNSGVRMSPQGSFRDPPDILPTDGYYSAWYYIPFAFAGKSNVFQFKQSDVTAWDESGNPTAHTQRMLWKISLDWDAVVAAYTVEIATRIDQATGQWRSGAPDVLHETPALVPTGEWFHLEVRYLWGENGTGHTTVWLNGHRIWDEAASTEASNLECLRWCRDWAVNHYLGDYQGYVAPGDSWIFVDDAAIASVRLGTG